MGTVTVHPAASVTVRNALYYSSSVEFQCHVENKISMQLDSESLGPKAAKSDAMYFQLHYIDLK
jgi:hypothetical protein